MSYQHAQPTPTGRPDPGHRRPSAMERFWFGAPYYPEHWSAAERAEDAARMAAAGFTMVRMAEFAWDLIEPEPGRYDFSLFDETIAALGAVGVQTMLCTPTATPPRWLTRQHPEILRVADSGEVMRHGSRQHADMAHPRFREASRRITTVMAEHYRDNPHVVAWQTDNEIYCHMESDHSQATEQVFQTFLREKFADDIAALNRAWGTAFWAQTYRSFDEIPLPKRMGPTYPNPAHELDYRRCLSQIAVVFQHEQIAILRAANPAWFIIHNGTFQGIDYRGCFGQDLDIYGHDAYPMFSTEPAQRACSAAFNIDRARSFTGNIFIPEHQSDAGGQRDFMVTSPEPGEMRSLSYASIARGADSLLYFRWRTCRFGAEQYWCGLIDHDNIPRRYYHEAAQLGREIATWQDDLLGTAVHVDCAVAGIDFDNRCAHDSLHFTLPSPVQMAERCHQLLYRRGHAVGCVHPDDDLEGLALYVIPHWCIIEAAWVPKLQAWVEAGGTLVIGARSGTRDGDNNTVASSKPGLLRPLCGVTVEDYGRQQPAAGRPLDISIGGQTIRSQHWFERLQLDDDVEALASWSSRHLAGSGAISRKRIGAGQVIYVATYLEEDLFGALLDHLADELPLAPIWPDLPPLVEVVRREKTGLQLWFVINHNDHRVSLPTSPAGTDLLTGQASGGPLQLEPYGVAVIRSAIESTV